MPGKQGLASEIKPRKFAVKGKDQCRFWARTLKFEQEIEYVQALMLEPGPRKWAAVPIVAEFEVEPDYKFYYFFVLRVGNLGIDEGDGIIWLTDQEHLEEVRKARDELADAVLKNLHEQRKFDEVLEMPSKKEDDDPPKTIRADHPR